MFNCSWIILTVARQNPHQIALVDWTRWNMLNKRVRMHLLIIAVCLFVENVAKSQRELDTNSAFRSVFRILVSLLQQSKICCAFLITAILPNNKQRCPFSAILIQYLTTHPLSRSFSRHFLFNKFCERARISQINTNTGRAGRVQEKKNKWAKADAKTLLTIDCNQ